MVQNGYAALRRLRNLTFALVLPVSPVFAADPVVVVALGDSLTAGYGLPVEDGFEKQLVGKRPGITRIQGAALQRG